LAFAADADAAEVVIWWPRPRSASDRASARLGGVPRNSQSATTSGVHRPSCRAIHSPRWPPPARMFQATILKVVCGPLARGSTSW